ncbi:hypothetical protein BDE36_2717 [Arcticibacter tournemirensis]|uniref:DUF4136 domain-containing protein n=1 Tax=Arcticibacter tournemirensis TaxID=699437 RepID=A0A5M9H9M9_9SPHI|nr:DUF4136 domain-containing protein [Arcticibacter tournemirensis]KAA8483360.1 DUF4136 domain-containing protein [Arcticibacter tournemirensis]TQM50950.1 hypothetical protein BDE36_2717 [Arcticibacter tournemirensis]
MKAIKKIFFSILTGMVLSACGTSTQIVGSWKKGGADTLTYKKVLVAALTNNLQAKQKVENALAAVFSVRGATVSRSLDVFPPDIESKNNKDKDAFLKKIKDYDTDLIVTNAVVDKKTQERYMGGGYAPWGWAGNFGGYYRGYYGRFYDPGYYTLDKVYYLETNVFDAKTDQLIWSAQSRTYNPSSLNSFIDDYAKVIVEKMTNDGILK